MTTPLGYQPEFTPLTLSIGASFTQTLQAPSGTTFANGTTCWINLLAGDIVLDTWQGTVSTSSVTWTVPHAQTDPIPLGARYRIYLQYPSTDPQEWMYGAVERAE